MALPAAPLVSCNSQRCLAESGDLDHIQLGKGVGYSVGSKVSFRSPRFARFSLLDLEQSVASCAARLPIAAKEAVMARWDANLPNDSSIADQCCGRWRGARLPLYLIVVILLLTFPTCGQDSRSAAMTTTRDEISSSGRLPANPQEEVRLGDAYLSGKGITKDPARAAFWYRKAADAGDPTAQNNLGYLYLTGTGIDHDEAEAAKWFARSLAGGSQQGKLNLALIYLKGSEKLRDLSLARDLLNELVQKGNAHAEDVLGVMYLTGEGVQQDVAVAEKWFMRAAKHGDAHGQYALGVMNSFQPGHEHNLLKAAKFLRRSAHGGYTRAMYLLGFLLVNYPEIPQKRPNEALDMLTRAAEGGQWEASALLGVLARDGRGMNPDPATAFRWFLIGTRQGGSEAQHRAGQDLSNCRQALNSDQQDQELRAAEQWLAQHSDADVYVFGDGLTIPQRAAYLLGNRSH